MGNAQRGLGIMVLTALSFEISCIWSLFNLVLQSNNSPSPKGNVSKGPKKLDLKRRVTVKAGLVNLGYFNITKALMFLALLRISTC